MCLQVLYGLRVAELRAGSSCADRSSVPSCGASCECRTPRHPVQPKRPNDERCELTACRRVRRRMQPTREQIVGGLESPRRYPGRDALPGVICDFELHRSLGFFLHEGRSRDHVVPHADILHVKSRQITCSKLAVDWQIERCQLADVR
jgi:hypothetical protein